MNESTTVGWVAEYDRYLSLTGDALYAEADRRSLTRFTCRVTRRKELGLVLRPEVIIGHDDSMRSAEDLRSEALAFVQKLKEQDK